MYKLFDLIRAVRNALQPYVVSVEWEGDVYQHRAWTVQDGVEWLAQYPRGSRGAVHTRILRKCIAQRYTHEDLQ